MDYRCVTDTTSAQYALINSDAITVGDDGLLRDQYGYVGVAIGHYYTNGVGERFVATFEDGSRAKFIVLDIKADKDTINQANHVSDGSMVEFVIDTGKAKTAYPDAIKMGNLDYADQFNGNIIKMEKVVNHYENLEV